jgi:AraC-like DNA-binding protein
MIRNSILGIVNSEMGKDNFPFRAEEKSMDVPILCWSDDINANCTPSIFYNAKGEATNHKSLKNNMRLASSLLTPTTIPEYWESFLPAELFFHMHVFYEINQIVSGTALYVISNQCIEVKAGDIITFNENLPHFWYPDPSNPPIVRIFYYFPSLLLSKNLTEEKYGTLYSLYSSDYPFLLFKRDSEMNQSIEKLLNNIFFEFNNESISYQLMIIANLLEMSSIVIRHLSRRSSDTLSHLKQMKLLGKSNTINIAIDFINKNYSNPELNSAHISQFVSMNSNYFSNLFKKNMGIPLTSYISQLRISKAVELIHNLELSITEISLLCGYESFSSFYRTFVAIIGKNPSEYRRSIQISDNIASNALSR